MSNSELLGHNRAKVSQEDLLSIGAKLQADILSLVSCTEYMYFLQTISLREKKWFNCLRWPMRPDGKNHHQLLMLRQKTLQQSYRENVISPYRPSPKNLCYAVCFLLTWKDYKQPCGVAPVRIWKITLFQALLRT